MNSIVPIMDSMPVGFRFRPTDEELVDHYLKHKLLSKDSNVNNVIAEVDVCKFQPWDLPALSVVKSDDPEWFFFCPRDYKYANSKKFNRATQCGYWKATGKDRNIKRRGTNSIIGTKKTLVFYKSHVPRGVKTSWVIHEYHAVTFDDSQRNFVLCRLMNKADKDIERRTVSLTCDEGKSSRNMGSNCENHASVEGIPEVSSSSLIDQLSPVETFDEAVPISYMFSQATIEGIPNVGATSAEMNLESIFEAPHQEDKYLPSSTQQSAIRIEQEGCCPNSPFLGAYFRKENNIMQTAFETIIEEDNELLDSSSYFRGENSSLQTPLDTIEEEDEFETSFLADADFVFSENIGHASVNGPTHLESLRSVYYESSDTDAEVVSTLCGNTLDTSTVFHEHPSSGEFHASKLSKLSHGDVHGSTSILSSNSEANQDKNETISRDDLLGMVTSSCDSTADKPSEINCIEISSSPSILRRRKNQYQPRSANVVSRRAAATAK